MKINFFLIHCFNILLLLGCTTVPKGVKPVRPFNINQYLGKWYEIARLDHSFEKNLTHVTADYTMNTDGSVNVINKGFRKECNQWKVAKGTAKFVESNHIGFLKVSFFGPFYGSYIIFELDKNYTYAFISGPNHSYVWLLSRTPFITQALKNHFIHKAKKLGFNTDQLIFTEQIQKNSS